MIGIQACQTTAGSDGVRGMFALKGAPVGGDAIG
jgi:hypothetical protein